MAFKRRRGYRRRRYVVRRRRIYPYRRSRLYKRSRYGMRRRSRRGYSRRSRGIGSVSTARVAGFGNKKTVVFRGYQGGFIPLTQTEGNDQWSPLSKDYKGLPRRHPMWFWDPFNQFTGDAGVTLTNPFDGLGIYKNNYNHGVTNSIYKKIKFTNMHENGVMDVIIGLTDTYTVMDKIPDGVRVVGQGNNFKFYSIGPGKSKTIRYRLQPQKWAKFRHENPTNTTVKMGPNAVTNRTDYATPIYDIYEQIFVSLPAVDTTIAATKFSVEHWQWSKVTFFNRRGVNIVETDAEKTMDFEAQQGYETFDPAEDYKPDIIKHGIEI